jgi:hypothetical protein
MRKNTILELQKGQTLVTLLVFMVVAITVTSSAAMIILNNTLNASKAEQGTVAMTIAESGIENAMLRILRSSTYTGETLAVGQGTAIITVTTNGSTKTITSTGTFFNTKRKLQVTVGYNAGLLVVTPPWQEIP